MYKSTRSAAFCARLFDDFIISPCGFLRHTILVLCLRFSGDLHGFFSAAFVFLRLLEKCRRKRRPPRCGTEGIVRRAVRDHARKAKCMDREKRCTCAGKADRNSEIKRKVRGQRFGEDGKYAQKLESIFDVCICKYTENGRLFWNLAPGCAFLRQMGRKTTESCAELAPDKPCATIDKLRKAWFNMK